MSASHAKLAANGLVETFIGVRSKAMAQQHTRVAW